MLVRHERREAFVGKRTSLRHGGAEAELWHMPGQTDSKHSDTDEQPLEEY